MRRCRSIEQDLSTLQPPFVTTAGEGGQGSHVVALQSVLSNPNPRHSSGVLSSRKGAWMGSDLSVESRGGETLKPSNS